MYNKKNIYIFTFSFACGNFTSLNEGGKQEDGKRRPGTKGEQKEKREKDNKRDIEKRGRVQVEVRGKERREQGIGGRERTQEVRKTGRS